MSNYYAKAINPKTGTVEKTVVLDIGKDTFIQFEDGWKYNLKFFKNEVMEDEQEAINEDTEYFGNPIDEDNRAHFLIGAIILAIGCLVLAIVL